MEMKQEFSVDDVTYVMTPANAVAAWSALKKAASLLRGLEFGHGQQPVSIGTLLSNLGDPVVNDIEKLVFEHTSVSIEGNAFKLSNKVNEHFNKYRSHMINVLVEGVKYQFSDFFSGGESLLSGLLPKTE
ncbi:phage tail assembly chaperone [Pragia fontium]|uniref:Phage tail assemb.y chaperone protein, TAC n=2 Tax=Pragia fontium TaxID=82985 RepID=A0AAJ4WAP2_9GAMM|nr:putative phage tail assembly chaperone [Pragia fontium]AKJ42830.1 hypothetical protein QQ39_12695 [Pragia fontium]SFC86157.1 Phage tail assemb.y chaperone protein, TAC [Pragia fontium DSM 5563 = ATCC 49100]SUB83218.1 Protein of uncharacterised function (DUF2669) [Pragia fontium]VEJ56113.1 Protein of uncharacterised function (DUF2669) [Pragia fontium]GKX62284.1 hypothetical protein SOASR032_08530 [Pragia fontium]